MKGLVLKKYIFISVGGFLGAVSRFLIREMSLFHYKGNFPLNTLIINITGSLVLALIITVSLEVWEFDSDLRLGITTGFLGAYTTFSTLCRESILLMQEGKYFSAVIYILATTILGMAAAYTGVIIARSVVLKIVRKESIEKAEDGMEDGVE